MKTLPRMIRTKRRNGNGQLLGLTRLDLLPQKTSVGKPFLKLTEQHFAKGHKLHKIFNKNTVKVSCSYLKNMGSVLSRHNQKILSRKKISMDVVVETRQNVLPVYNNCLTPRIIYKADCLN